MRYYLLNSAMMPCEGSYKLSRITKEEFIAIINKAYLEGKLINTLGYQSNIDLINKWCDLRLQINRTEVKSLSDGDILIIMKLKYRLNDVRLKADRNFQTQLNEDDFEFFIANYEEEKNGNNS